MDPERERHRPPPAVGEYYSGRLAEHGATARGVDWNGQPGQVLRFDQLLRLVDTDTRFSLCDLGCGYGALLDHIRPRYAGFDYRGWDVSDAMIAAARALHPGEREAFSVGARPDVRSDYCVASGIFNVRLETSREQWQSYVEAVLDVMHEASARGFAFNCLTAYADEHRKRPDLYYADPLHYFDLCRRRHSRQVALLHDYGLYEFTLLVRKAT